jgi:hypothetical protein
MDSQSQRFAAGACVALRGELSGAERAARAVGGKGRLIFLYSVWLEVYQVEPSEEGQLWAGPYIIPSD